MGVWGICVVGGHAPRLRSRPERASDMHPQAPNTQTCLPACLLPTACDYNGLDFFDPLSDFFDAALAAFFDAALANFFDAYFLVVFVVLLELEAGPLEGVGLGAVITAGVWCPRAAALAATAAASYGKKPPLRHACTRKSGISVCRGPCL